jgi:hypothetical protein
LDAAVALVYAAERWNDPKYLAKAKAIGEKLQAWTLDPESGLPNLGDWVAKNPAEYQDRGLGPKLFHYVSRPSDFSAAAAFSVLEKAGAGDPAKWARARTQGLSSLDTLLGEAALPPDFTVWDPAAKRVMRPQRGVTLLEKYTDSEFSWNSCRVPWRVAARIVQDPTDAQARAVGQKLANFYARQDKLCVMVEGGAVGRVDGGAGERERPTPSPPRSSPFPFQLRRLQAARDAAPGDV